ncbi:MAG: hypothetical protein CTY33_01195 [Methylotenera sp.]|nr:MAG: hypothetical protein CTY33_01195 [Methylotenera sp.]
MRQLFAYYLLPTDSFSLDFLDLAAQKEGLARQTKAKQKAIQLGSEEFMLASHGTGSGYPYLIENEVFSIQFGEFNQPNFFVKFRSFALWHYGAKALHDRFMAWAESIGMAPSQPERLSRIDYAFDYYLPEIDFNADSFISTAEKDNQYRKNGKVQNFKFGTDDIGMRLYNKVDEINEKSQKTWFFDLWGIDHDVWRAEFQVRKGILRQFGITSVGSLLERQGDLMRFLVKEHTTLRIQSSDTNRSRWSMHPLWLDLIERVNEMQGLGVARELNELALLEERLTRISISVLGYVKRVAAIDAIYKGAENEKSYIDEAFTNLQNRIMEIYDPLSWQMDVNKRIKEMKLGEW